MSDSQELLSVLARYLEDDAASISLPADAYASTELYELERDQIFGRSWVLIAHQSQLALPGDYVALTVAGEPVLVARDRDGALHGMSPICRHRMMPVVPPGAGRAEAFVCPYHLWTYGLDGRLAGATYMRGNKAFDPAACRLPAFAVEQWHGFVFVNLDPRAEPLSPHLSRADAELASYRVEQMVQIGTWSEEWRANWKLAVANAHENYHAMGLHPNTVALITPRGADMDIRVDTPWVTRLASPFKEPIEPQLVELTGEQKSSMYNYCVFPSGSIATFGESIIWISFIPLAIDRTEVRGGVLMPPAVLGHPALDRIRKDSEASTAAVNGEDQRGLEAVQTSVRSRFADRGQLSPKEPGVIAFYRNLARAMSGGPGDRIR